MWAWRALILLAALLGFALPFITEPAGSAGAEASPAEGAGSLALLEIQGRILVGTKHLLDILPAASRGGSSDDLVEAVRTMAKDAGTDRAALGVAALSAWLAPDLAAPPADALSLLEARLKKPAPENDPVRPLIPLGQRLLSGGTATESEAKALKEQLGWFAPLLLERTDAASRQRLGEQCLPGAVLMMVLPLAGILLGLAGATLCLLAIVLHGSGRFRFRLPSAESLGISPDTAQRFELVFTQAFAVYLAIMMACNLPWLDALGIPLAVTGLLGAFLVGLFLPRFRHLPWAETRLLLGWHRGRGLLREVACGVVGYIAMLPLVAIGITIMLFLLWLSGALSGSGGGGLAGGEAGGPGPSPPVHPIVYQVAHGGWGVKLAILALAAVIAPLFEETMFRGLFFRALRRRHAFFVSGLVSGVVFAMVHPQGWMAIPALGAIGLGFAGLREWRDSLIAPMTAHALNNGLIMMLLFTIFGG